MDNVFVSVGKVEVKLNKPVQLIKETLSRIGIANREQKKIYPSCYVYDENGKIFIVHFKEVLRVPKLTDVDLKRRNTILWLLNKWNLISFVHPDQADEVLSNIQSKKVFILSKEEKNNGWTTENHYHYRDEKKEGVNEV